MICFIFIRFKKSVSVFAVVFRLRKSQALEGHRREPRVKPQDSGAAAGLPFRLEWVALISPPVRDEVRAAAP